MSSSYSDYQAVVHIFYTRNCKVPCIMHFLCNLRMSAARHHVQEAQPLPTALPPQPLLTLCTLEQQCWSFLSQGLAPSTRKSYTSAQRIFVEFCRQLRKLHLSGFRSPAEEWALLLFATYLKQSLHHFSIKVYLSCVPALHIRQGFPDSLLD